MKSAKENDNTVTWSTNLHMTEEARLPGRGKSPDTFENEDQIIGKRSYRENTNDSSI